MAITLGRFGVPLAGGGGRGMMKQPKVKYRYRVSFFNYGFLGDDTSPITLETNTCGIPTRNHEPQEVHGYNSVAYYGSKPTWEPIELAVRDTIDNAVSRLIIRQDQQQFDHFNQVAFRAAVDYKFMMAIEYMDGTDDGVLFTWNLEGCFISAFNYGDGLDYSDSGPVVISMTVRYDNAYATDENNNILSASPGTESTSVIL